MVKKIDKRGTSLPMDKTTQILIGVVVLILIAGFLIFTFYAQIAGWIRAIPNYSQQEGKEISGVGTDEEVVSEICPEGFVGRFGETKTAGNSVQPIIYLDGSNTLFYVYENQIYFGEIESSSRPIHPVVGSFKDEIIYFNEGIFDETSDFFWDLRIKYYYGKSNKFPEKIIEVASEFQGAEFRKGYFCKSQNGKPEIKHLFDKSIQVYDDVDAINQGTFGKNKNIGLFRLMDLKEGGYDQVYLVKGEGYNSVPFYSIFADKVSESLLDNLFNSFIGIFSSEKGDQIGVIFRDGNIWIDENYVGWLKEESDARAFENAYLFYSGGPELSGVSSKKSQGTYYVRINHNLNENSYKELFKK